MDVRKTFEQSVEQIKAAREHTKHGFPCECGGIMRETGNVATCILDEKGEPAKTCKGKFVDRYQLKCDKCGTQDFFQAEVKHLTKISDQSETQ